MNGREVIRNQIDWGDQILQSYLGDLTDSDLLVRPVPGANHIAWQLGHLISSENVMVNAICPGVMPPLPEGFADQHKNDKAGENSPAAFRTKDEYLRLYQEQRAGTLKALERLTDADLDKPVPPGYEYMKTWADMMGMQATHYVMHAGQWAIVRRKLGKPPLF